MKVNMTPNPLDVVTIHASQGDTEARQWKFELHNNGELIDTSDVKEQLVFKAYKGGTEQLLPENTSTPTTSPIIADIKYPQGLLTDQEFTYRQSPTEEDGLAKITDIKGNTLNWNQLVPLNAIRLSGEVTPNRGLSYTNNNDGSITLSGTATENGVTSFYFIADNVLPCIQNHKYLTDANCRIFGSGTPTDSGHGFTSTSNGYMRLWARIPVVANSAYNLTYYPQIFDLTQMFGSSKADEIYAMEQATEGSGIAYFKSLFPLPYYAYNQGSLLSFNGNGIKTVGKNQINLGDSKSATANGVTASYDASTQKVALSGTNTKTDNAYILINFIPSAIPKFKIGETYVVSASSQIPTNTYFNLVYRDTNNAFQGLSITQIETRRAWRFTVPSNYSTFNSFQIGVLKEARQLNGEFGVQLEFGNQATAYEPYTESLLNLPISTYFPTGMKSAGSVYDELTPTKAITRIGAVDLGTLTWNKGSTSFYTDSLASLIKIPSGGNDVANMLTSANMVVKSTNSYSGVAGSYEAYISIVSPNSGRLVWAYPLESAVDGTAFATLMSGVYLYYELATPTETPITTASLVTENAEIPLSNEDGVLIGKCTEQLSSESGFFDAKIKLTDSDGDVYSNKIQLHIERSPQ